MKLPLEEQVKLVVWAVQQARTLPIPSVEFGINGVEIAPDESGMPLEHRISCISEWVN